MSAGTERLAKYEPASGCYLGAYIELDPKLTKVLIDSSGNKRKLPEEFESVVGKEHAMYFFYLGYGRPLPTDWVNALTNRNKIVHIALEPNDGLEKVKDDDYLRGLADALWASGAVVFLRFASEMNGEWTNYSGNPKQYKEKWRLVANVMRERARNVAMVWCPYATPRGNIDSYYPGDEWVDWVGVNMYNVTYFNQDPDMPAHDVSPRDLLDPLYKAYSKRKPIMICEYATTHYSALENKPVVEFAVENIRNLYGSLDSKYPRVKAVNYFNSNNLLIQHRQNNDYTITSDPKVLEAYRNAIAGEHFLSAIEGQAARSPLSSGTVVTGKAAISAKLTGATDAAVRVLLDGKVAHIGLRDGFWELHVNTAKLGVGEHKVTFEAYNPKGILIATKTAYFVAE